MVDALTLEHSMYCPEKLPIVFYTMEGANFVYRPMHEERYFSNMTIGEVPDFKLYDSDSMMGLKI